MTSRRISHRWTAAWTALVLAAPASASAQIALPNLFISPAGKPFRAEIGQPYAVAQWFAEADANHDGRLDRTEFKADAEAFFTVLDRNGDGALNNFEVAVYERRIAPEILALIASADAPRLWRAQYIPPTRNSGDGASYGSDTRIDPGGGRPNEPRRRNPTDELGQGAQPFSLIGAPEPVTSADPNYLFSGFVRKTAFLQTIDQRFSQLDTAAQGYLTLAGLPQTAAQRLVTAQGGRRSKTP
jgi:hypothetical protein